MVVGGDGHKGVPHYYRGTQEKNFFFCMFVIHIGGYDAANRTK